MLSRHRQLDAGELWPRCPSSPHVPPWDGPALAFTITLPRQHALPQPPLPPALPLGAWPGSEAPLKPAGSWAQLGTAGQHRHLSRDWSGTQPGAGFSINWGMPGRCCEFLNYLAGFKSPVSLVGLSKYQFQPLEVFFPRASGPTQPFIILLETGGLCLALGDDLLRWKFLCPI